MSRTQVRPQPTRRVAARRRSRRTPRSWLLVVVIVLFTGMGAVVLLLPRPVGAAGTRTLIFAMQRTQEEGAPLVPAELRARAEELAASRNARLVVVQAAGDGGRQAGPTVELRVDREPGQPENDPTARRAGADRLLDGAITMATATPPAGDGRDLASLLSAISAVRGYGDNEVWLVTFGLGTRDPADARVLMAADPGQAASAVAADLHGVSLARTTIHLVLAPPAGDQPWLTARTAAWREAFDTALLRGLGGDVVSVQADLVARASSPGAPAAPVVPNLPDATPTPPTPPHGPISVPLDTATFFQPDSATLAGSRQDVLASLKPIVDGVRSGQYARIEVVGRCARFGPAGSARELSLQRAQAVADLLRSQGVVVDPTDVRGIGYDDPLPPDPRDPANRSVTVTSQPVQ